jgi:hypothetical protein
MAAPDWQFLTQIIPAAIQINYGMLYLLRE